jgi:GH25 family lysozyme M1 (1,4-beta-N-acetylmuramidase)
MVDILIVDVSAANALGAAPGRASLQDDLDWTWLRAQGVRGAIVEGFIGNDGPNLDFEAQLADAAAAGIAVGEYDFPFCGLPNADGHPDRDPISQARLHAAHGRVWRPGDIPTMADFEWPAPQDLAKWSTSWPAIDTWCGQYLLERDRLAGCKVGIYSYPWWWESFAAGIAGGFDPVYLVRPLWCSGSAAPWVKAPFTDWTLWQRTGQELMVPTRTGRPPVKTDCSVFNGDEDAWQAFLGLS